MSELKTIDKIELKSKIKSKTQNHEIYEAEAESEINMVLNHLKYSKQILKMQTIVLKEITNFFTEKGFVQLMPLILSPITDPLAPDPNASVKNVIEVECYGQKFKLMQSMILHKQISLISGAKRIFIISPNIRIEDEKKALTGRHCFEFSQVDFEIADGKMQDVFRLIEEFLVRVIKRVKKECKEELKTLGRELRIPKTPFKVFTTHELEEKFGRDWEEISSNESKEPFWVTCHRREFYDKEDQKAEGHYLNYDLIYPEGFGEGLSGGEREYEYKKLLKKLSGRRELLEQFKHYLELSRKGLLVPSAGAGFGFERLIRFLTGKRRIEEVQLFPRIPGKKVIV
ncbi:MAG: asparagine synthetase A [Candidatus Woesearchaeota archaeon]